MVTEYDELRAVAQRILVEMNKKGSTKKKSQGVVSAGCVVHRFNEKKRRVEIILGRVSKTWGIPKGHVEQGESESECAARETFEETGVSVNVGARVNVEVSTLAGKRVVAFYATPIGDPMKTVPQCIVSPTLGKPELSTVCWISIDSIPNVGYQRLLIDDAVEHLTTLYARQLFDET